MNRGLYPVLAGAITQERQMELLAHNIGNIHTAGFKKDNAVFGTILARSVGPHIAGIDLFPQVATVRPDVTQGTLRYTGNDMDVALEGKGFFVIRTANGERHYRGGHFQINGKNELATFSGDPVLGVNGPITMPSGPVAIDKNGVVHVGRKVVGTLRIEQLPETEISIKAGDLYWVAPRNAVPAKNVRVRQGSVEQSNVNPSMELVNMIKVTRGYEQMQKAIQTMDELTGQIIQSSRVQG
ncbi:MAG: flagellar hook-basal body protein [Nitrospirota bacterium]|nr:flagellar hook-basal body protein [Nitrospirota bacterium]